ncbi:MAG: ribosomal RNA small subunit methyltransferase A [Deltaproteobacteria bacterium]|nr:ribosomal RNA small subunit methyltransferase A [Deltaproteobacteria bacterium]
MNRPFSKRFGNLTPPPRKRFGQNFLVDRNIAGKIIETADVGEGETIVEIGPGRGALTGGLLDAGAEVVAIEIDRDLAAALGERFVDTEGIEILCADALGFSYLDLAERRGGRLKVVANLPYNISTPILFKLLDEREAFTSLLLMLQREVAERIVAGPGTKEYGVLTIFSQLLADVRIEFHIPPTAFSPRPKVESSLVRFDILKQPRVDVEDTALFKRVVKAAFGTRRKTILNALKSLGLSREELLGVLEAAGIDPRSRGETLTLASFALLSSVIGGEREGVTA